MGTQRGHRVPRRGFTLLELMIALTLTAIAAGVAGTALSAARGASARVADHRRHGEAELRLRAALADMLRHTPAAESVNEALLSIERNATGATLQFLSRGVRPPFGTGPVWRVRLTHDSDGLLLRAEPLAADSAEPPLLMRLPDAQALDVLVLERATGLDASRWRPDWPLVQSRPAAVALTWSRDPDTREAGAEATLVVALDPLEAGRP